MSIEDRTRIEFNRLDLLPFAVDQIQYPLHLLRSLVKAPGSLVLHLSFVLALAGCATPRELMPSGIAPPASGGAHATNIDRITQRELTVSDLLAFQRQDGRKPGPGGRFYGYDVLGTYRGHRFAVQYICSDMCPDYTVTVHHFIDLRTPEACAAIGGQMQGRWVPWGIANARRSFCMASPEMKDPT